jgi:hypothetical protein
MYYPLAKNPSDYSNDELDKRITEVSSKINSAMHASSNMAVIQHMNSILDGLRDEQRQRMIKEQENDPELNDLIDIKK